MFLAPRLDSFSVVLQLTRVSVDTGGAISGPHRGCTDSETSVGSSATPPGPSIHAISERFAVSPRIVLRAWRIFIWAGNYSRTAGQGC